MQRGVEALRREIDADLVVVEVEQPDLLLAGPLLDDRHRAVALGVERGGDAIGIGGALGRCRGGELSSRRDDRCSMTRAGGGAAECT